MVNIALVKVLMGNYFCFVQLTLIRPNPEKPKKPDPIL